MSQKAWKPGVTLYSFQLQGSNRWFRTGTTEPKFREGDFISFTNDAKGNVDLTSVSVGGAPAQQNFTPPAPVQQQAAPAPRRAAPQMNQATGQNRDGYWAEKEQRDLEKERVYRETDVPSMRFSAAQDRAVQLVSAALAHGVLSFGNAKAANKLDMLLGFVDQVTDRFVLQNEDAPASLAALKERAAVDSVFSGPSDEQGEESYE